MPQNAPMVSVVIPVYNAHATLRACLDSVLGQSFEALEVLAVNDGSADDSAAILEEYRRADARLRVFSLANGGVSAARNCAINQATGAYLQFVDSDDVLPHDATRSMVTALTTQRCDLVIAPYTEVLPMQRQVRGFLRNDMVLSQTDFLGRLSAHPNSFYYSVMWNKLYRRDLVILNSIRCDPELPWGEDFAFNMLYDRYVESVAVLSKPVYDYHKSLSGLTVGSARLCIAHPIYSVRIKLKLRKYYRQLYEATGLYDEYRHEISKFMFQFTINN